MSDTTYHRINDDDNNRSSSYSFWTWLIAIIAAIYLFWAWQHDRGPNYAGTCCNGAPAEVAAPVAAPEPFSFSAGTIEDYHATGDASGVSWANDATALKDWLNNGTDWRVEGNANEVTLTGTVDSEETKAARGEEAQAFFGSDVTVNNQLTVVEPVMPEPALAPENAVVYFASGISELPDTASSTLANVVDWLQNHPESKAVISGYHDPSGNKAFNIWLSKNRAQSVYDYLASQGISTDRIEMREPINIEGTGSYSEARRAEVSVE